MKHSSIRRNAFILFWGFLLSVSPAFLIIVVVAIYYSARYRDAFSPENVLSEGRRALRGTIIGLRPFLGFVSLTGLVCGLTLGFMQKLPGTKVKAVTRKQVPTAKSSD